MMDYDYRPGTPIPENPVYFWPDNAKKQKRRLKISIMKYQSYDHYYVSIDLEENPFWSEEDQTWVKIGRVTDQGSDFWFDCRDGRFDHAWQAKARIDAVCARFFAEPDLYDVRIDNFTDIEDNTFFYKREGD